jgi:uncharacterized protein
VTVEKVHFRGPAGSQLYGVFYKLPGSYRVVIINHGFDETMLDMLGEAKVFLKAGISVFLWDYRGFGMSTGESTFETLQDEGYFPCDYLHAYYGYYLDDMMVMGKSLGCGTACNLARHRSACALILENAFPSVPELLKSKMAVLKIYPDFIFPQPHMNVMGYLKGTHAPLLFVSGLTDRTVPPALSVAVANQASDHKRLLTLPDTGGGTLGFGPAGAYATALLGFLEELGLTKPPAPHKE